MHESVGETLFGRGVPAREGRLTHLGQRTDGQTDRQTDWAQREQTLTHWSYRANTPNDYLG